MFTGLIEEIGTISVCRAREGGREIAVSYPELAADGLRPGDSIAAAGVCLTVERVESGRFWARVMPQTADTTTLGKARSGQRVNLERALKVGDRLGGHFVLGHVDGLATVLRVERQGDAWLVEVEFPTSLGKYIVPRGSICLDGVSLTVAELNNNRLTVSLVKETLERTTLGEVRPGDKMNLEVDILAKHIVALLPESSASRGAPSSLDSLLSTFNSEPSTQG
ncbi:MAG: riboflavin synthase [Armatimonadetes bacterium]|nr:riboflavin synthase [Armatimonadota bacterium]NIO74877.1 riboflavin synthase [Armatimonadota bacterium]NIO95638.1 riboflavin synthase [Armatimonadota bacterium]